MRRSGGGSEAAGRMLVPVEVRVAVPLPSERRRSAVALWAESTEPSRRGWVSREVERCGEEPWERCARGVRREGVTARNGCLLELGRSSSWLLPVLWFPWVKRHVSPRKQRPMRKSPQDWRLLESWRRLSVRSWWRVLHLSGSRSGSLRRAEGGSECAWREGVPVVLRPSWYRSLPVLEGVSRRRRGRPRCSWGEGVSLVRRIRSRG